MEYKTRQYKAETAEQAESLVKEKLGYAKIFEYYHGLGLYNPTPLPKDWDYSCGEPHTVLAIELRGRLSGLITICEHLTLNENVNNERNRAAEVLGKILPACEPVRKKKIRSRGRVFYKR